MSYQERHLSASVSVPLRLLLDCDFVAVRRCAAQIRSYLAANNISERDIWACELAFVEGCNNAVQHTPRISLSKKLLLELSCAPTHIELRINDHTRGFDFPEAAELPSADEESGRGIFLMQSLMDKVDYVRGSSTNCLILKRSIAGI